MIERGADIEGPYRYFLSRFWGGVWSPRIITWVMLNPSTANAFQDDPTIRRCRGFSQAWGYNGFVVVNLYAWRAADQKDLWKARTRGEDIVGPRWEESLRNGLEQSSQTVLVGWGSGSNRTALTKEQAQRLKKILLDLDKRPLCLGTNGDGSPCHPLYKKAGTPIQMYDWREI